MHRFFAPALDPGDELVTLPRGEAEHLTRVLRLGVGDMVSVFDGRGREYLARIVSAARRDVRVQIVQPVQPVPEPAVPIVLVQAVLKGERMDDVVRDAVMLGAAAVQPIVSKRTEATVAGLLRGAKIDRWRRVALASTKQSRRAVVPEIRMPLAFESYLSEPPPSRRLMLVEPAATTAAQPLAALRQERQPADADVLVGPEGGWTAEECEAAHAHGVALVTLGRRTLRADAVPVAAIAVLQFLWGDL